MLEMCTGGTEKKENVQLCQVQEQEQNMVRLLHRGPSFLWKECQVSVTFHL
jgi:hypothetical protein